MLRTYSTALEVSAQQDAVLMAYAELFARAEHTLHAAVERRLSRGEKADAKSFKNAFLTRFGLTARQFNAVRVTLDGRRDAIKALDKERLLQLEAQLRKLRIKRSGMAKLRGTAKSADSRRKHALHEARLHDRIERKMAQVARLKARVAAGRVSLCFGAKRRFNAQHHLSLNGHADHTAWRSAWQAARAGQFMCLGSKDETGGNQSCTAVRGADGTLTLRLRLPDALIGPDRPKYLHLASVHFPYGQADVIASLSRGTALSYRFIRVQDGRWRIAVTTEVLRDVAPATTIHAGRLGVDINSGFLLVTETDRFGNKVRARRFNTPERGLTQYQRQAARGEAVKALLDWAKATFKPIVLEDLALDAKKTGRWEDTNRKVSALAYAALRRQIEARGLDTGVEVQIVNPAYSSVQGRLKAVGLGLSVHGGAAYVLARRGQGYRERLPKASSLHRVDVRGCVFQWRAPARMPAGGGAAAWREVSKGLSQALAAHHRERRAAARPQGSNALPRDAMVLGGTPGLNDEI